MDSLPDATLFQLVSSSALQGLLDKIVGPKTLVLSPSLAGPLGLVTEVGLLKNQHGVTKMFWLEPGALSQAERNIVYLCRPEVKWMKMIADQIESSPAPNAHMYHLLVVPRMTTLCTSTLSELGVLGSIDVQEFQLGLIPLEKDLLSLEYEDVYRKLFLEGDYAPVYDMGKALMTIQRAFGLIPRIIGKGDQAKRLTDLLHRLRKELPLASPSSTPLANGTIDSMIVLDRQADMVTPLCTQLTYEGLVDEVIGIRNSHVDVDPNLLNPAPAASTSTPSASNFAAVPKKKKHLLSSSDSLFSELRDKNFAVVGSILNRTARRLNDDYERRHQAKTPAELRQFVGQLGGLQNEHQSLRLHTGLTEQIMAVTATDEFNTALEVQQNLIAGVDLPAQENSIRDLINQEAPLRTVLRLLCLYSVISGGLKPKVMEEFKREILQTYGFHHVPLLLSLHSLSLLTRSTPQKSPFSLARKPLRLVVDDVDEQDPTDISYVFSGYAPLSVRLVQAAITPASGGAGNGARANGSGGGGGNGSQLNGWKAVEEVLRPLPGLTFEDWQKEDESPHSRPPAHHQVPTTIVCLLGGVTYAEIAALRFLNKQTPGRNLLIVTTSCVQGSSLLTSLQPEATRTSA